VGSTAGERADTPAARVTGRRLASREYVDRSAPLPQPLEDPKQTEGPHEAGLTTPHPLGLAAEGWQSERYEIPYNRTGDDDTSGRLGWSAYAHIRRVAQPPYSPGRYPRRGRHLPRCLAGLAPLP
jgi:hypothetical protein